MTDVLWLAAGDWPLDWSGVAAACAVVRGAVPDRPLPPFPLIATQADARADLVVAEPAMLQRVLRNIVARPRAAGVAVELLRAIDGLAPELALAQESLAFATLQGSAEFGDWLARRRPVTAVPGAARVLVERRGEMLAIRLDRAAARNAVDGAMRDALYDAFLLAALDHGVACAEVSAAGRCFSVGGDLAEFGVTRDPATAHAIRRRSLPALVLARRPDRFRFRVHGACIGAGVEMAAFAGVVIATRDAWFQLPELAMGLIPGAGGCVSLPRRIGRQRTALLLFSGRRIDAVTALRWGLVDRIEDDVPGGDGQADQRRR